MNQAPQNTDALNQTMLYKCPGPHEIHGGRFDYVVVPEADIEEAQAQGWHLTTEEARVAHEATIAAAPVVLAPVASAAPTFPEVGAPASTLKAAPVDLTPQEEAAPATYDEMKTKATQLGLEYPGNISKAALLAMITAKLAEQG